MGNNSRSPLGDISNTSKEVDRKEQKRERDRARWQQQKDAINKRRRETYHQKKKPHVETTDYDDATSNKENVDPMEVDDWLHRNDSYQTQNIVDENISTLLSYNMEIRTIEDNSIGFTNTLVGATKACVQSTSKSNYMSEWYKNMTPEQREARRERQRLHNREPKHKEAMKLSQKKFKEAQKHILHSDSIAMENPSFSPTLVWPTVDTHGSTTKSTDWVIPEFYICVLWY